MKGNLTGDSHEWRSFMVFPEFHMNLRGKFWKKESFAPVARSLEQLKRVRAYIRNKPKLKRS